MSLIEKYIHEAVGKVVENEMMVHHSKEISLHRLDPKHTAFIQVLLEPIEGTNNNAIAGLVIHHVYNEHDYIMGKSPDENGNYIKIPSCFFYKEETAKFLRQYNLGLNYMQPHNSNEGGDHFITKYSIKNNNIQINETMLLQTLEEIHNYLLYIQQNHKDKSMRDIEVVYHVMNEYECKEFALLSLAYKPGLVIHFK